MNKPIYLDFDRNWIEDDKGCWIWQRSFKGKEAKNGGGYGCLRIKGKLVGAHIFSFERAYGPVASGMQILHSCHNTKCVNPAHLRQGTNEENQAEKAAAFRSPSKLSSAAITDIRTSAANGEFQSSIARRHNLHQGDVSNIVNRKYWKHVA